jgi:hypothetical protein
MSPDCGTIFVRKSIYNSTELEPKTADAIREVDVCSNWRRSSSPILVGLSATEHPAGLPPSDSERP